MRTFLQARIPDTADQIGAMLDARGMRKADLPGDELAAIEAIVAGIDFAGWAVLIGEIEEMLADVVRDGTVAALGQIGVGVDAAAVSAPWATQYGAQRAAAMVGMKIDALGGAIPNPNAAWQITESTRQMLRATITDAVAEGWSNDRLAKELRDTYAFSNARAEVIARTETSLAANAGALESYRQSQVVTGTEWLTAEDDRVTPDCVMNGEAGVVALGERFPSGAFAPPDHPQCRCSLAPVVDWEKLDAIPELTTTE